MALSFTIVACNISQTALKTHMYDFLWEQMCPENRKSCNEEALMLPFYYSRQ